MDLAQRVGAFRGQLSDVKNVDRNSNDKRNELCNALDALSQAWLTLSDLFRSGDLQVRPDFEVTLNRIIDDLENIIENLDAWLTEALRQHQAANEALTYIHPNHVAAHPLRIFFRNTIVRLRRKHIAYGATVLDLISAASNHIIARAYRHRPNGHIAAATARQLDTITSEEVAKQEAQAQENLNRHDTLPPASQWLDGFTWTREGDLPLSIVANQWFIDTPRFRSARPVADAIGQTQLNNAIAEMNRRHEDALQLIRGEMERCQRRNNHHIASLQAQLARAARQHQHDAETLNGLSMSVAHLNTELDELRAVNARLTEDNHRLQDALNRSGNDRAALIICEHEVERLTEQNHALTRKIAHLQAENATRFRQAMDAHADLTRLQDRRPPRRSNNSGPYPPNSFSENTNQNQTRDPSPAGSRRSSRTSRSTLNHAYISDSSATYVESRTGRGRRRSASRSTRGSSQRSSTPNRVSIPIGWAARESREAPIRVQKKQGQTLWSRFTRKMRSLSGDRTRESYMV